MLLQQPVRQFGVLLTEDRSTPSIGRQLGRMSLTLTAVAGPSDGDSMVGLDGFRVARVALCRHSAVLGWGGRGLVAVGLRPAEAALEPLEALVHGRPGALPELPADRRP